MMKSIAVLCAVVFSVLATSGYRGAKFINQSNCRTVLNPVISYSSHN